MYLREVSSPRKHGPDATYLQLVEGVRNPKSGKVQTRILHSFGRKDQLDTQRIRRLVHQLSHYLEAGQQPHIPGLDITHTWDFGGPYLLDALWGELQLDSFFLEALQQRAFEHPVERALFTLVAQRALCPDSKRAATRWAGRRAWIPGLPRGGQGLAPQHFYRAMDFLFEAMPALQQHLYFQLTDLLNADVSVLFYDTTSVSFYLDDADAEEQAGGAGLRRYGYSKKRRPDLPQIVVALAINRQGLPVRHWVFPGNQADVTTVEQVSAELQGLRPRRFLFVGDRALVSQENLDCLESRRMPYLLGCKLRSDEVADQVLGLRGRYRPVTDKLGVKETTLSQGGRKIRYLLCYDQQRAAHDAQVRAQLVAALEAKLEGSRSQAHHTRNSCQLLSHPRFARYLRELKGGGLRVDRGKLQAEARLDGKWVLMTNALDLPAEELVWGYRDLWRVERAFRSMKSVLDIEPVYHRTPQRITAHVHLCVLAYLMTRVVEMRTQESWERVREQLELISLSQLEGQGMRVLRTKRLSAVEEKLLKKCGVKAPPRIVELA